MCETACFTPYVGLLQPNPKPKALPKPSFLSAAELFQPNAELFQPIAELSQPIAELSQPNAELFLPNATFLYTLDHDE